MSGWAPAQTSAVAVVLLLATAGTAAAQQGPGVTACDRLAADGYDAHAVAPGVETIDPAVAVPACRTVAAAWPEIPRLRYQLAAALVADGRLPDALDLYRPLAEAGYAAAQSDLGWLVMQGLAGGPADDAEAVRWFGLAAAQGYVPAQYNLAHMYEAGRGVPADDAQAARWYRPAAEAGDIASQAQLGLFYAAGRGVPRDDAEAAIWIRRAAEQGDAESQRRLGLFHARGRGVPRDEAEARHWYGLAAEQGDAAAETALGVLHARGQGTPRDYAAALAWFRRAAARHEAEAQAWIAWMYRTGNGVVADPTRAAIWYGRALANGGDSLVRNSLETLDAAAQSAALAFFAAALGLPPDAASTLPLADRLIALARQERDRGLPID
jgi:TPR repeat protein